MVVKLQDQIINLEGFRFIDKRSKFYIKRLEDGTEEDAIVYFIYIEYQDKSYNTVSYDEEKDRDCAYNKLMELWG